MGAVKDIDIEIQNNKEFWGQKIEGLEMSRINLLELAGEHSIVLYHFLKQSDNEFINETFRDRPLEDIIEELNDFTKESQKVFDLQVEEHRDNEYKVNVKRDNDLDMEM